MPEVLFNGVTVGSLVVGRKHGIKKYGKVAEIDNDANRSSSRHGNVLIQYFQPDDLGDASGWYHGIDVQLLTIEACQQHRQELRQVLKELDTAQGLIQN
jgi:hypothetical protein